MTPLMEVMAMMRLMVVQEMTPSMQVLGMMSLLGEQALMSLTGEQELIPLLMAILVPQQLLLM